MKSRVIGIHCGGCVFKPLMCVISLRTPVAVSKVKVYAANVLHVTVPSSLTWFANPLRRLPINS